MMDSDLFIMSLIGSFLQVVDKFTERTEHRYMPVKDEPSDGECLLHNGHTRTALHSKL